VASSGAHGWVIGGIAHLAHASPPRATTGIPGYREMAAVDPGFSRAQIEDRAALVFWAWLQAWAAGCPELAGRHATPRATGS
jgi:hypothetical protein